MRPFGALISYQEAKEVIDRHTSPIMRIEAVLIDDAVNRILAEDLVAKINVPPFTRSAMDGYAVKAKDTFDAGQFKPQVFKIIGELHAGENPTKKIKSGECIQISTGAVMPEGADSVIMVEDTEREENEVKVFKSITPGTNIGKMGGDIKAGVVILKAGIVLDAGKVGVIASQGLSKIKVYEKPRIAVIPTGEEVKNCSPGSFMILTHIQFPRWSAPAAAYRSGLTLPGIKPRNYAPPSKKPSRVTLWCFPEGHPWASATC